MVSSYFSHLPELPGAKIPMDTHCPLVKANYKLLKGHNDPFTKNVTQYSYTGIQGFGYKKTPVTFEVTSVCKRIEFCGAVVI